MTLLGTDETEISKYFISGGIFPFILFRSFLDVVMAHFIYPNGAQMAKLVQKIQSRSVALWEKGRCAVSRKQSVAPTRGIGQIHFPHLVT